MRNGIRSASRFQERQMSWNSESMKKAGAKALLISSLLLPGVPAAQAVPLGEHTTCAYPACTTQEEILKANAPQLMSAEERQGLTQDLKDMQFIVDNVFFKMLEEKDYPSMRAGLRQSPMMNLRLTVRKYKDLLPDDQKKSFMTKYNKMIDNLDSFDVFVFKRTQGGSSDKEVEKFLKATVVDFDEMMKVSGIPATAAAATAESTPTQSL
jgi:hypothetical protein